MIANIGYFVLVMTFVLALYGAAAAAIGALRQRPALVESGRHAMLLTFPLISLPALSIIALLAGGRRGGREPATSPGGWPPPPGCRGLFPGGWGPSWRTRPPACG